ncbi:MAG: pilin [Betaproteobacteria bacterium]|nr:pilin [Betaproteobacteria bacterium]
MRKVQAGFTLIELLIVVAIIGILAAVAIPAYQDYTIKAKISEGPSLVGAVKTTVAAFYQSNGTFPTSNTTAGLAAATDIKGNHVKSITVGANGKITVAYTSGLTGLTKFDYSYQPVASAGSITWNCNADQLAPAKYQPKCN